MTPADVLKLAELEGVVITLDAAGDLVVVPAPSLELDAAIGANVDALCELLAKPCHRGPCGEAAGCDADGFGWQLPEGLIPLLDAAGRFCGWMLDPAWKPERLDVASPKPEPAHNPVGLKQDLPCADIPPRLR